MLFIERLADKLQSIRKEQIRKAYLRSVLNYSITLP